MNADAGFVEVTQRDRAAVETRLSDLVDRLASHHDGMREAIRYSLLEGGKRVRPLLCLWTHDALGGSRRDAALDAACAVECVHSYSLVHDDLPCMDDDDFRRGRPSSHRRFDEATAVLAGDALLNLAYEIVFTLGERHALPDSTIITAGRSLALAAGTGGLISGQALDLSATGGGDVRLVERIHENKTARLIAAAFEIGAAFADAPPQVRERFRRAGTGVGLAFQIVDDLLDLEGSKEMLGKTPGKDVHGDKLTYPSVVGRDGARRRASELVAAALGDLPEAGGTPLAAMIGRVVERDS